LVRQMAHRSGPARLGGRLGLRRLAIRTYSPSCAVPPSGSAQVGDTSFDIARPYGSWSLAPLPAGVRAAATESRRAFAHSPALGHPMNREDLSRPPADGMLLVAVISDVLGRLPSGGVVSVVRVAEEASAQLPPSISLQAIRDAVAQHASQRGFVVDFD